MWSISDGLVLDGVQIVFQPFELGFDGGRG